LGYLQIVQHDKYQAQAADEHTRKYQIPATRGELYAYDGSSVVPIVLNQTRHVLYVDPRYIEDRDAVATQLAAITGAKAVDYRSRIDQGIEYAVLERRISNDMATKIKELGIKGVGLTPTAYRTYPEGSLAAQVLGFVNADSIGQYGVEGFLNEQLAGQPGQLAAKTDTRGIPIATADNVIKPAEDGKNYVLTIDRNIQAMAEQRLAEQISAVKAKSGSIVIMDTDGAVRAMANYPTFDPNAYSQVADYSVFMNQVVSSQFEPGSGMKAFAMAIGLDQKKVTPETTYDDTGSVKVADKVISNAEGDKAGSGKSMTVVLRDSLNTGMVFVLKMIGGNADAVAFKIFDRMISPMMAEFQFIGLAA
jgi:cell division protein FtsI/penicillin-binding protein 2